MKEANRGFVSQSIFTDRVKAIMEQQNITLDMLHSIITKKIGYDITKNNLSIYIQRLPNVNFLVALTKALNTTSDYLLGIDKNFQNTNGFNYRFTSNEYLKYEGRYYFYFYPTVSNSPATIHVAELFIKPESQYQVELKIQTDEKREKAYYGNLLLSTSYSIGYIHLKGDGFGDIVNLTFCDPTLNVTESKVKIIIGGMLSVSSGDMKRIPVMSRFILSREKIDPLFYDILKANLILNTKYINISKSNIENSLINAIENEELRNEIFQRLTSAFIEKKFYMIEESFIINTLKNDYLLSPNETTQILTQMRLHSMSNANNKINKTLDSRLHKALFENKSK